jgi:hypothetical protein
MPATIAIEYRTRNTVRSRIGTRLSTEIRRDRRPERA